MDRNGNPWNDAAVRVSFSGKAVGSAGYLRDADYSRNCRTENIGERIK